MLAETPNTVTSLHNPHNQAGNYTLPVINLNGDRPETLAKRYEAALEAVTSALDALALLNPHARNYYPVEGAYERAREEYDAQSIALANVRHYLRAHYYHARKSAPSRARPAAMENA